MKFGSITILAGLIGAIWGAVWMIVIYLRHMDTRRNAGSFLIKVSWCLDHSNQNIKLGSADYLTHRKVLNRQKRIPLGTVNPEQFPVRAGRVQGWLPCLTTPRKGAVRCKTKRYSHNALAQLFGR